tara:strand:- start:224 stop:370 length:147 start_codon:yes stop_codon:yes gene_type:complete
MTKLEKLKADLDAARDAAANAYVAACGAAADAVDAVDAYKKELDKQND